MRSRLRVLMYHKISADGARDALTVPVEQLEVHFRHLRSRGYTTVLLRDLIDYVCQGKRLPSKPVLITFDDGYKDNHALAYPLARKYGLKMNLFLVPAFIEGEPGYIRLPDLQRMDPDVVDFGLHSSRHQSYADLSEEEVAADIARCIHWFENRRLRFSPCLAYPYGAYPRRKNRTFFERVGRSGMVLAFRIGNRLNALPLRNPMLIQRIDVRGNETFGKFRRGLALGKKWL